VTGPLDAVEEVDRVVRDAVVFDAVTVAILADERVGGAVIVNDGVADAAEVDGPNVTNATIGGLMRVTGADDVGLDADESSVELVVRSMRRDPRSVVSAR